MKKQKNSVRKEKKKRKKDKKKKRMALLTLCIREEAKRFIAA